MSLHAQFSNRVACFHSISADNSLFAFFTHYHSMNFIYLFILYFGSTNVKVNIWRCHLQCFASRKVAAYFVALKEIRISFTNLNI